MQYIFWSGSAKQKWFVEIHPASGGVDCACLLTFRWKCQILYSRNISPEISKKTTNIFCLKCEKIKRNRKRRVGKADSSGQLVCLLAVPVSYKRRNNFSILTNTFCNLNKYILHYNMNSNWRVRWCLVVVGWAACYPPLCTLRNILPSLYKYIFKIGQICRMTRLYGCTFLQNKCQKFQIKKNHNNMKIHVFCSVH